MQFSWKNPLKALPVLLLLAMYASAAFGAAGNVQFVIGDAKLITPAGVTRALQKGDAINEGDRVVTAANASAQIKMVDGGFIAIRPNTDMGFDTYRYSGKEDGSESAIVSLLRGGFRTITGIIGRTNKQNYLIKTATATIGIRGTDHEPMVILPPAPGQAPVAEAGTYDKVNVGVAFIRTDLGSVDIQANQVGFASVTKAAPVILPRIPPFYKPTPAPGPQQAEEEKKEGAKTETAAAGTGETAAEAPAEIRETAVVDPASSVATGGTETTAAAAPEATQPVVAITATNASGTLLNTTTQTTTTESGTTTAIVPGTGEPVVPPVTPPTSTDVVNFSSTSVLRDEALWSTTQIAPGANPAVTTYIVSDKSRSNLYNNSSGTPSTPLTTPLTTPVTLTGPTGNTNFLFDASGNLTKILDTPHVVYDHGNDVPGSSTQFAAPTPLANAELLFGTGSTAAETYYDPGTEIRFGRWSGGEIKVTDLATGNSYVEPLLAPDGSARSAQWVVAQVPSSLPTTGVFHYTRILDGSNVPSYATAPSDSYGNVGTLEGARLSADFTNMTASAGVRITMPSGPAGSLGTQNLSARFDNAPISSGGFNVSTGSDNPPGTDNLHVGCFGAGCAPNQTYGGRIRGGFDSATGDAGTADGAFFRYTFNTHYGALGVTPPTGRVVDDYISGLVAFGQGPQIKIPTSGAYPVAAPAAPVSVVATYGFDDGLGPRTGGSTYYIEQPASGGLVTDSAGNLLEVKEDPLSIWGDSQALALSGGTPTPSTPTAYAIGSTSTATDGSILLGWRSASPSLTVSGEDWDGCFGIGCSANPTPRTVFTDGLSWVRGPAPFPLYLPGAIAGYSNSGGVVIPGSATYNLGASILHDQSGAAGTVNSAGLTVNFGRSNVAFNMDATTGAGNWLVSATGLRLDQEGSFFAHGGVSGTTTIFSGTSVAPTDAHENMSISLNGSGTNTWGNLEGQLMGIGVGGAGVTFNLNSPSATASGALAFGLSGTPYSTLTPYNMMLYTIGMTGAGEFDPQENTRIDGGFNSPYRTEMVNNFPVRIDGALPVVVTNGSPCTGICSYTSDLAVVYTTAGATAQAGVVDSIGTATLLESGYDLATGIRWGRYGGGTVGVNDRISGQNLGTLDITDQNVHMLISTNQSGPTVLPITGTFNYAFVGGTSPTDSNGNVGAALTAANASLTANFTAQTVDATLSNLSVGGISWNASASGMPIQNNVFQAERKLGGGGNLLVTNSVDTAGTNTAGKLIGAFTGATGGGAGVAYSLNHGGNNFPNPSAVTVSGVAVFKR